MTTQSTSQAQPSRTIRRGAIIATILTTTALAMGPAVAGADAATTMHADCDTWVCGSNHSEGLVSARA